MRSKTGPLKLITAIMLCMTVLVVDCTVVHATTISDLEKEKQELEDRKKEEEEKKKEQQRNLNSANSKADSLKGQISEVSDEIDEIDASIVETMATIEIIEDDIAEKEKQIEETTAEYEEAKASEEEQYESMKLRIKYMYEKGDYTYMEILLQSSSFADMVNKAEYVEKLYEYDRKLLIKYQEAKEYTLSVKQRLEDEKDELDTTLFELNEEKESLDQMLSEKQSEYEDYSARLDQARREASVYKANIEKQNEQIRKLEKLSADKQNEIDAAVKAEEERKRAEEEERRRASESSSDGGGSSSPSRSYASASSFSGSKGQQIASYALQFVGNPYVPGGTSLTEGADCSGFVWRVYKDFGYSLPRTSTAMRGAGYEVSFSDAQPGDIICYAGHVGMYIGNGNIVHASTQKTGIKTTNALYKSIITVRRIV